MKKIFFRLLQYIKENPLTTTLIVIAAFLHLLVIVPSGSHYCFGTNCGDFFWGVNEHDGIWHIAVAESAFKTFPPRNPIFSGAMLSGYNSLLDFILYVFSLVGISPFIMYFKIMPIVWFTSFTYFAIKLSTRIHKSKTFTFLFLFLSYFGASFSFIIPLFKAKSFIGTSSLLSMQSILTLTNVQLAFSYVFLFLILIILYSKKISKKEIALLCVYIFFQWGLKFYAGFISTVIVGSYLLMKWINERNKKYFFFVLFISASSLISIVLNYNPFGQVGNNGMPFSFSPLSLVWPLIEDPSMFYSAYWSNAKYTLLASSKLSPRLLIMMVGLTITYIVLNIGPRILGIYMLLKKCITKKASVLDFSIFIGIVLSLVFPILFIQRGIWWNTVQFFFPVFILLNIYTAEFIVNRKNKIVRSALVLILIMVSIPYTVEALKGYINPGVIIVSDSEKKALSFLKTLPDGVVYSPLYNPNPLLNKNGAISISNHVDSSYIPAYTGKQMYYANFVQLVLLNIKQEQRREQIIKGECSLSTTISYVYFNKNTIDSFIKKCVLKGSSFSALYSHDGYHIYSSMQRGSL